MRKSVLLAPIFLLFIPTATANAEVRDISSLSDEQIVEEYNTLKEGFTKKGKAWKEFLISHKKVVEVDGDTVEFHYNEILSYDTLFTSASSTEISTTSGFEETNSISTTESVSKATESTLKAGIGIEGTELSTSAKMSKSYTTSTSKEYSFSYSESLTETYTFDAEDYVIPEDASWCIATVGDYISFKMESYEIKNWWGKWKVTGSKKEIEVKLITFTYKTPAFSDGTFVSKGARSYFIE